MRPRVKLPGAEQTTASLLLQLFLHLCLPHLTCLKCKCVYDDVPKQHTHMRAVHFGFKSDGEGRDGERVETVGGQWFVLRRFCPKISENYKLI